MVRGLKRFNLFRAISLNWVFVPFQWEYLASHDYSGTTILLLNAIFTATAVVCEIPTGVLADRIGRKKVLSLGALIMVVGCGFFLVGGEFRSFVHFALANVFAALAMTMISGKDSAYLYDLMAAQDALGRYPRVEGTSTACKLLGNVGGFVAGSLLARQAIELTFGVTALLALTASVIAATLPEPPVARKNEIERHLGESLRIVRTSRIIIGVMCFSMFLFPLLRVGIFLDPVHAELHSIPVAFMGYAFAAKDLVAAASSMNAGRLIRWLGKGPILLLLPSVSALAFLVQGITHGPWCFGVYLLPALAFGLFSPVIRIIINENVTHSERRATVLSIEGMFRRLGYVFFSPIIGWLVDSFTLGAAFVSLAFLGFAASGISALIVVIGNGKLRKAPGERPAPDNVTPIGRARRARAEAETPTRSSAGRAAR
jgi:MFS family permease